MLESFLPSARFSLVVLSTPGYWHYVLPSTELESRGLIFSTDALFFRLPQAIVELVSSKAWPESKLAIAALPVSGVWQTMS